MNFSHITYEVANNICKIKLNTPKNLNSICLPMYNDILSGLNLAEEDDNVKVIVLSGNGKAFCGGGNIFEMQYNLQTYGDVGFDVLAVKAAEISNTILKSRKLVIASVHGAVAGAAFNIILSCDIVLASNETKFIQAFIKLGLIPDAGGFYLLSRAVGTSKAKQLVFTGDTLTASDALDLGIIYRICDIDSLESETDSFALEFANGPIKAYASLKELIYKSSYLDFSSYLESEVKHQVDLGTTKDFSEGVNSFIEKRKAIFIGE